MTHTISNIKRLNLAVTLMLLLSQLSLYAQTGIEVPELAQVDLTVQAFIETWEVPGLSVGVVKDGRLIYARAFGYANIDNSELVLPEHLFRIASISKTVTAIAVLKMVDDGILNVEDHVFGPDGILNDTIYSNYQDSRVLDITVEHLLKHLGGWNRDVSGDPMFQSLYIASIMGVDPPPSPETIIQYVLNRDLDFNPGTQYAYSNFGYCILGRVLEELSGLSYEEYVQSNILEPLGITDMQVGRNLYEERADMEVYHYDYPQANLSYSVYGTGELVQTPYGGYDIEAMDSHGGWIASPTDLLRLLIAVDGILATPDILSPNTIEMMVTPSSANPNYAMGWAVHSNGTWWHSGSLPGTSSIMVKRYDGVDWVVLVNFRPQNWGVFDVALDNLMWDALSGIAVWPEHNLFVPVSVETTFDPTSFQLLQNFPNPFNPTTTIRYGIPEDSNVSLVIYDVRGQVVQTVASEQQSAGWYDFVWNGQTADGKTISTGIYFARLVAGEYSQVIKMLYLK